MQGEKSFFVDLVDSSNEEGHREKKRVLLSEKDED